jgi:hypothetical protein
MLPLATDEDVSGKLIRGLRARMPAIDLVRVVEAGLTGRPDPALLEWAATEGRIFISEDESTLTGFAWDRVRAGLPMPGVIVRRKAVSVRRAIEDLLVIAGCGVAEDFKDQVRFLPL